VEDVNDNAPFLNMPDGLVWPENTPPGETAIETVGNLETILFILAGIRAMKKDGGTTIILVTVLLTLCETTVDAYCLGF
jgi:hypothetical protein